MDDTDAVSCAVLAPISQRLDEGWLEAIVAAAPNYYDAGPYSEAKTNADFKRALMYFKARGATKWSLITPELSREWYGAGTRRRDGKAKPPKGSTVTNRQWTLRLMFKVAAALGAEINPYTAAGEPVKREPPDATARPLTDDEDRRVCAYGDPGPVPTMGSMAVALSRAGASATELPDVRRRDVDLDAATVRFTGPSARVCPLDAWSVEIIARRLRAVLHEPDDLLCVRSNASPRRAAQSVTVQLNKVLAAAGFSGDPEVTGRSLRLTAARRAFEVDRNIEDAARVLGARSLDATADAIRWRWQQEGDPDEPLGQDRHLATPADPSADALPVAPAVSSSRAAPVALRDATGAALRLVPPIGDGDG